MIQFLKYLTSFLQITFPQYNHDADTWQTEAKLRDNNWQLCLQLKKITAYKKIFGYILATFLWN